MANKKALSIGYAKILFEVCEEEQVSAQILYEIRELNKICDKQIKDVLTMPTISMSKKFDLIDCISEDLNPLLVNFIKILIESNHLKFFSNIEKEYENIYLEKNNIEIVNVKTSKKVQGNILDELVIKLNGLLNKDVVVYQNIDENLIGGIQIKYGTKEINNTIKKHLREFTSQL